MVDTDSDTDTDTICYSTTATLMSPPFFSVCCQGGRHLRPTFIMLSLFLWHWHQCQSACTTFMSPPVFFLQFVVREVAISDPHSQCCLSSTPSLSVTLTPVPVCLCYPHVTSGVFSSLFSGRSPFATHIHNAVCLPLPLSFCPPHPLSGWTWAWSGTVTFHVAMLYTLHTNCVPIFPRVRLGVSDAITGSVQCWKLYFLCWPWNLSDKAETGECQRPILLFLFFSFLFFWFSDCKVKL